MATRLAAAKASAGLPSSRYVLAVCAHPDDESFGLRAAIARFCELVSDAPVLRFTHGEASTLGQTNEVDLGALRQHDVAAAAEILGAPPTTSHLAGRALHFGQAIFQFEPSAS